MSEVTEIVSLQDSRESQTILWIVLLVTAVTAFSERLFLELLPSLALGVVLGYVPVAVAPIVGDSLELGPSSDERRLLTSWSLLFASAYVIYLFTAWSYQLSMTVGAIVVVAFMGTIHSIAVKV